MNSVQNMFFRALDQMPFNSLNGWAQDNSTAAKVVKVACLIIGGALFASSSLGGKAVVGLAAVGAIVLFSLNILGFFSTESDETAPVSDSSNRAPVPDRSRSPLSRQLYALHDPRCRGSICGVYLASNETGREGVAEVLRQKPQVLQSCHIGFSGWQNFDIMALRNSTYGMICDFNPHNKVLIDKTVEVLKRSESKEAFAKSMIRWATGIEKAKMRAVNTPAYQSKMEFSLSMQDGVFLIADEIRNELHREGSWLSRDDTFQYIKSRAMQGKIEALTIDIRDSRRFHQLAKVYQDNNIQVDTLYLSNICGYMLEESDKAAYKETAYALMEADTSVINCPRSLRDSIEGSPFQQVFTGRILRGLGEESLFEFNPQSLG